MDVGEVLQRRNRTHVAVWADNDNGPVGSDAIRLIASTAGALVHILIVKQEPDSRGESTGRHVGWLCAHFDQWGLKNAGTSV